MRQAETGAPAGRLPTASEALAEIERQRRDRSELELQTACAAIYLTALDHIASGDLTRGKIVERAKRAIIEARPYRTILHEIEREKVAGESGRLVTGGGSGA